MTTLVTDWSQQDDQRSVFRQVRHPELWAYVAHLTGRPGRRATGFPESIAALSGEERLRDILEERAVRAYTTFFAPSPVVCFTESTPTGLGYFFEEVGYEPWGIVFSKQRVYDGGGGPVFHVRADEWDQTREWREPMRSRAVRLEPGSSEWLEEREWRVPGNGDPPAFRFELADVAAVIVGRLPWTAPDRVIVQQYGDGSMATTRVRPRLAPGIRKWLWDPATQRLVEEPRSSG